MGISQRFIPLHSLHHKLEKSVINSLLKLHILTCCDVTSKVGTKSAAIKVSQEVSISKFCSILSNEHDFKDAELYLVNVLHGKLTYSTFNELWYVTFLMFFFQLTIFLHYSKQQKSDNRKVILLLTIKEQSFNCLNSLINLNAFTG